MSTYTAPIDFGPRGMAAALNMTLDEFKLAWARGEVSPPDLMRGQDPRWGAMALAAELNKRPRLDVFDAVLRAKQAEGEPPGVIPLHYDTWPHTRRELEFQRSIAITDSRHRLLDEAEREFEAEDNARLASWKTIIRAEQSSRATGEEDPA